MSIRYLWRTCGGGTEAAARTQEGGGTHQRLPPNARVRRARLAYVQVVLQVLRPPTRVWRVVVQLGTEGVRKGGQAPERQAILRNGVAQSQW